MSMDSIAGSQLLSTLSQSSSPRLDSDQMSIKSEDENVTKVKLMCSYGGRIMIRPHDSQLRYIGGDTRILVVARTITYADLCNKLSRICGGRSVFPKYKLPYEDYDALVSVICEEDLEAMMEEYDRLDAQEAPSKLRLFLFPKTKQSLSFDSTNSEQTFLEVLNGALDQPQQQQLAEQSPDFMFGLESLGCPTSEQEVIIDRPGGASATSSGSSVVQNMIEADSALQSELPPIYTAKPRTPPPPVQHAPEPPVILQSQAPINPFGMDSSSAPVYIQQQARAIQVPQFQNLVTNIPVPPVSVPVPQSQILPPKGPKPKVSSPHAPDGSKKEKNKPEAGSPNKGGKLPTDATLGLPANVEILVVDGVESLRLGESPSRRSTGSPVEKSEEQQQTEPAEIPTKHGSSESVKEMSLNVFIEQQLKEELSKEKNVGVNPPTQNFPSTNAVEHQTIHQHQPQQPFVQPQVHYVHPGQAHQPYIIENNMVYFLADTNQLQHQHPPPQIQYLHPPLPAAHVNPLPVQFQRGGSAPLIATRPYPLVSPLQRQLSAAYVEQQPQPKQQQQQQQQRVVYPVSRTAPGAQSPSRFREPMSSQVPVQVQQFEAVPQMQVIRPQQVPVPRAQPYETEPNVVVLPVSQQMPFSATTSPMPFLGTP